MTTTSTATVIGSTTTAAPPDDLQTAIALALMGYGSAASSAAQSQAQAQAAANAARYASGFGDPALSAYSSAFTGGASSIPAPVYTVTAADMNSGNPWAAIAQTLYGTNDAAAAAQLQASQAALGSGALRVGVQLTPPVSLSFESSQSASVSLNTSALTTIAGGWKPVTLLESGAAGAYDPQVAFAANGDGLSVWSQGPDLMASVYSKATGLWSAPTAIDGNLVGDPYQAQLSVSANGNMLVTWLQYDPTTYVSNTYARRFVNGAWDASATTIPKLNAGVPSVYYPVGAISDSGRAVVLFASSDGQWNMVANTFNGSSWQSTASNLDDVGGLNNNSLLSALRPRVAMDAAGNATALWVQSANGETAASLMVSRYSVATGQWSAPSSTALENTAVNVDAFRIASDNQGNALVAWRQGSSLFAKSYSASTAQWSAATTLSSTASGDPTLSMSATGHAVISYSSGTEVHARRFSAGAWQGTAQLLGMASTSAATAARAPNAAINSRGDIIVTFLQSGGVSPGTNTSTTAEQVYSQQYQSQTNSWTAPEATQTAPGAAQKPVAAIDEQGNAQVVMSLHATGDNTHSIYSRRYAQSEQYFEVPAGATWESLTQQLYGTTESAAVSALKNLLSPATGQPSQSANPTPGTRLRNLPETLNYKRPVATSVTVNPEALMRASMVSSAAVSITAPTAAAPTPAPAAAPVPAPIPAPTITIQSLMATPTAERQAAQDRVDALITYASRQYTELASAMSAAAFAQTSLQTWNQMRAQHQAAHGSLAISTGWSEADYQAIVATAARTQAAAEQATAVRNQTVYELQSAQAALNAHIDAAYAAASNTVRAASAAASSAVSAAATSTASSASSTASSTSTPTAVFGGGGVPSTSTAPPSAATLAALAILGYGTPAANAAARATVLAATGGTEGSAATSTPTSTAVFGGGGVRSSNTGGPDAATRAALALLGYGTLANNLATLTQPPRERPAQQWADIKAVWLDRNDEPALLMQLMRQYGFDAADLAYATGQTLAQVGNYLQQHGAADGFAGWSFSRGYVGSGAVPTVPTVTATTDGTGQGATRPPEQWAAIKAVWLDRRDEPYRLMQTMVEFGFDAADIAYATGQSAQAVGDYLTLNGAPAGFAGAVTVGQRAIDAAYLQALDAALAHPVYAQLRLNAPGSDTIGLLGTVTQSSPSDTPWWTYYEVNNYDDRRQWASFDVQKFNRWYLTQNSSAQSPDTQAFVRLHGADLSPSGFSLSGAQLTLGGWVTQQRGQNEIVVWQPSQIRWAQSEPGTQLKAYLSYPAAPTVERQTLQQLVLQDPVNVELLQRYGQATELPQTEQGERMRARYGSELATQLLQLSQATQRVRAAYNQALEAAMHQGNYLAMLRTGDYGQSRTTMDRDVVDPARPWWITTHHTEHDNNQVWSRFDIPAFHRWYTQQDTPESRLFVALHGSELTTVTRRGSRDEGYAEANEYYIGDAQGFAIQLGRHEYTGDHTAERWVPGGLSPSSSNALAPISLERPPKMYDASVVFFDPVMGYVTLADNIKPETDLIGTLLPLAIIAAAAWFSAGTLGPQAAVGMGLGTSTTAAGLTSYALTTAGVVVAGGVTGLTTAFVSGAVNGNLNLKSVLQGALGGALTAGLLQGLQAYLPNIPSSELRSTIEFGGRVTIQGAVQAITGGSFEAGLASGLVSNLASAITQNMGDGIDAAVKANTMTANEAIAARYFGRVFTSALRIAASPSNPGQAFASAFIDDVLRSVPQPGVAGTGTNTAWSKAPINGLTIDDGWTLNPTLPGTGGLAPVQSSITGSLAIDYSAPAVPAVLLSGGVSANQVFAVRDGAGQLYYAIDGVDQLYSPAAFVSRAQAVLNQAGAGLANASLTPSQVLEASRYLSAVQTTTSAHQSVLIDVYADGQWYRESGSNSSASPTPRPATTESFLQERASMSDYWGRVEEAGVNNGSFGQYLFGKAMGTLGNIGYNLLQAGAATSDDPSDAFLGAIKGGVLNFGPDMFNGATHLVKIAADGWTLLAENIGFGEGTFLGWRESTPGNIELIFKYDNSTQATVGTLANLAVGAGLSKFGDYSVQWRTSEPGVLYSNPIPVRLSPPPITSEGTANAATGMQLHKELAAKAQIKPDTSLDAQYIAKTDQSVLTSNSFDTNHSLSGEINANRRATGYHAEFAAEGSARINPEGTIIQYANGTYRAPVQVFDVTKGKWVDKGGNGSTFFPLSWSEARINFEVTEAFKIRRVNPDGGWLGTSPSGVQVQFYWDPKNQRTTFYPLGG